MIRHHFTWTLSPGSQSHVTCIGCLGTEMGGGGCRSGNQGQSKPVQVLDARDLSDEPMAAPLISPFCE